ncbi:MAG: aldo/keto reductase [Oscillospiraceae bacterium]|nr:aldo/keto reductase [Oscillospiraceae bacterium]
MIYREFQDIRLSALGMGAMRLPVLDGDDAGIDEAQTFRMVDAAMAGGVNYYDTAWGYHDGHSELVLGKALARYPRDSFYLADKFPGYDLSNFGKVKEIFEEQLRKCGVDHFDFYLFHNVCELNIEQYLDEERYKTWSYLMEQKRSGRIRHLGFSAHGSVEVIRRFLAAYGKDMEFCQLQLNWLDWEFQGGKEKAELLREWNIPIWVMEPLRGGKLASLPEEDAAMLRSFRSAESVPGWAFRFLQGISGITVILSGMSDEAQMADNLRTFETDEPLKEEEAAALLALASKMTKRTALPCTACRYCTSHCPQGLNIPWLLELYNEHVFTGGGFLAPMALMSLPEDKKPSACIGCRSCEQVCPQQIKISEAMKDFCGKLAASDQP